MRQPNPFYAGGITGTTYTAVTLRARWALGVTSTHEPASAA